MFRSIERAAVVSAVLVLAACGEDTVALLKADAGHPDSGTSHVADGGTHHTGDGGSDAGSASDAGIPDAGAPDAGYEGPRIGQCNANTLYIYTIAADNTLYRFAPATSQFQAIGKLNCNALFASAFSMAVDRYANIWVVFTNGSLYRVDAVTAACKATSFKPFQSGFTTFGMGFAANSPGSQNETLFVSGDSNNGLASIDTTTLVLKPISHYSGLTGSGITGRAELSGNGTAHLWGAFEGSPFVVAEIDQTNGKILSESPQSGVGTSSSGGSNFAFAAWNGGFYLFVGPGGATNVYYYDPTNNSTTLKTSVSYEIVGAGVSTCAPTGQ